MSDWSSHTAQISRLWSATGCFNFCCGVCHGTGGSVLANRGLLCLGTNAQVVERLHEAVQG